jgi:general stress protein 26
MGNDNPIDREWLWDRLEMERVCMFATMADDGIVSRPMTPYCNQSESIIWFVTDRNASLIHESAVSDDQPV